ncbi:MULTISPECIES: hypothetical protein [unclassified Rhodococcus (in: high G+C Gram-positive bacteria)]|uniref:hypothetical protein n=1 Tax=Rhodococcus sp. SJ-3 TaxID=3454628 RepID=UPI002D9A4B2A|nr:hypothetical protein [Rhodococcus sp. (in: high G+C Gram-positive bacteria)]
MSYSSISSAESLRVAVEFVDGSGPDVWADLTVDRDGGGPLDLSAAPRTVVRVRAADLREARKLRDRARADASAEGRDPDALTVLVDLEVIVDLEARVARRRAQDAWRRAGGGAAGLSYVGTPTGLAGLIADIHAVKVADGVTLIPVAGGITVDNIVDGTLPWLESRGLIEISPSSAELGRRFAAGRGRATDRPDGRVALAS